MRKAEPFDVAIGDRIRRVRRERGLSQRDLALVLGVTAQQVQKYERGLVRVSVGRLAWIAICLSVPVTVFFEEARHPVAAHLRLGGQAPHADDVRHDADELDYAFRKIGEERIRRAVLALVRCISSTNDGSVG
jgi:transcriptional regulator with XRE-family HTH domain